MKYLSFLSFLILLVLTGCRSPESHRQQADLAAGQIISNAQANAFGAPQPFAVERPSDTLRRRLLLDQRLPSGTNTVSPGSTGSVAVLSFADCLQAGARNNNDYQNFKEDVFRAALALDLEQFAFDSTFSGLLTGSVESDTTGEEDVNKATGGFKAGVTRKLKSGATLAGSIALDVVQLLSGNDESSFGVLVDATVTIPLLRGAGREIVTEPLTQAERNVLYALLLFERYKTGFAVQVAKDYLAVLQAQERVVIAQDNLDRLETGLRRAEQLARAGRLPETELDQTHQDVLRARTLLVSVQQRVEAVRDALKSTLGLPADARIALDDSILAKLASVMDDRSADGTPRLVIPSEAEALRTALEQRLDLKVALYATEDAERKIRVAANALKAGVALNMAASTTDRRYTGGTQSDVQFGHGTYSGGLELDLPWTRREERNAYREAFLALDRARRATEQKEDEIKGEVRNALRSLEETAEAYAIQTKALLLAEKRVKSTAMFFKSGRAQTRDLLEAQEALVNAQSALTDALVAYHSAYWNLLRDTGKLQVDAEGVWNLDYQHEMGEGKK